MKTTVVWLRDELRLHDNALLAKAMSGKRESVLPVFCLDPRTYSASAVAKGFPSSFPHFDKCGALRAKFVLESLEDLNENLSNRGSGLRVSELPPLETFSRLLEEFDVDEIFCSEGACQEEIDDEAAVASLNVKMTKVWEGTMYHRDDVPAPDDVFTNWRTKVEKAQTPIRDEIVLPKQLPPSPATNEMVPKLSDLGFARDASSDARGDFFDPVGGETAGLARLRRYIWEENRLSTYFDTRNGMIGQGYSTKFAPWLARGCLSPRRVAHECRKYENARVKNKSTYWVVFELTWRDFFELTARKHGSKLFWRYGFKGIAPQQEWAGASSPSFKAWTLGRTGAPLVDANMRELVATGFMSNRGRQNVASYLVHDLGVDWRLGAAFFEAHLVDYTAPANWGNWHAAAGLNGGRINRFNVVKQSRDYDPDGKYIKLWCPELEQVPAPHIFEPHKLSRADQVRYKVEIGVDYPRPVAAPRKTFNDNNASKGRRKARKDRRDYY